jgi:two-component system, OmpR family, alkaline phosphatase synthesis response regulator PhoP
MIVTRVVVAEDDAPIRELLLHHLEREGFYCRAAADGPAALRLARGDADVLVLDVGLPVVDGFDVVRTLRREGRDVPIVMLTARCEEVDRVVGLEIGADDYVVKPFSPREVVARVKAIARRARAPRAHVPVVLTFDRLEIDEAAREVRVDGVDVRLKPREFDLLLELARNAGVAFSRESLLHRVWGPEWHGDDRTVDVHVRRIRRRIEDHGGAPSVLHTIHGFGYKFARA